MKSIEVCKKYHIKTQTFYKMITDFKIQGIEFTRNGKEYDFTNEDVKKIEAELKRRRGV